MRHHYIPQFLLGAWAAANSDGKIEAFRLDVTGLPSSRHFTKSTGYENNRYALDRPIVAGMAQQAIETLLLKGIDNYAAIVRRKLDEKGLHSLSVDEHRDWVTFLMSLRARDPEVVSQLKMESSADLKRVLAEQPEQYEGLRAVCDAPTLEEWIKSHFPGLIENYSLSLFHDTVLNEYAGNRIIRMQWHLWDLRSARNTLMLADRPCIFSSGIDDPNLIIALPISPTKAFMATSSAQTAVAIRQEKPATIALRINESSVAQARVRLYAVDASARRFVFNRLRRLRPIVRPAAASIAPHARVPSASNAR